MIDCVHTRLILKLYSCLLYSTDGPERVRPGYHDDGQTFALTASLTLDHAIHNMQLRDNSQGIHMHDIHLPNRRFICFLICIYTCRRHILRTS
jgi:hypothetical protein